jgi:hypothetical protein
VADGGRANPRRSRLHVGRRRRGDIAPARPHRLRNQDDASGRSRPQFHADHRRPRLRGPGDGDPQQVRPPGAADRFAGGADGRRAARSPATERGPRRALDRALARGSREARSLATDLPRDRRGACGRNRVRGQRRSGAVLHEGFRAGDRGRHQLSKGYAQGAERHVLADASHHPVLGRRGGRRHLLRRPDRGAGGRRRSAGAPASRKA